MIIVSDTSPIINLAIINQLDLLHSLYQEIIIPPSVFSEITVTGAGQPGSERIGSLSWLMVKAASDRNLVHALSIELDEGEAEAIALAVEMKADLLLIDERKGREVAAKFGLNYIGLIGVLLEAKEQRIIANVKPVIDDLRTLAGFWIRQDFYAYILKLSREE